MESKRIEPHAGRTADVLERIGAANRHESVEQVPVGAIERSRERNRR